MEMDNNVKAENPMEQTNSAEKGLRQEAAPAEPSQMEILFVDDEKNVLQSLKRVFMDEDYDITIANSGEEALEIIKANDNFGLIVSDQRMPGLTGVDFFEKAKEILPDALRILLTGYADINAVADAINRGGAYRYITKPWKDDELLQVIHEAAKRYSLTQENKRLEALVAKQNEELKNWNTQLEVIVQEQTMEIQNKNKVLQEMNRNLKENFKNTIMAFSGLIALRDRKAKNHSKNVAEIAVKMAKALSLDGKQIESVAVAALLHDIGKIGMHDRFFTMDVEKMDAEGKREYVQHPVRGQAAIDSVVDLRSAGVLIRHHHEWHNGEGFPDGLSGDQIPVGAQIISMADYFDRMFGKSTTAESLDDSLDMVNQAIGKRFDSKMYPALQNAVKEIYSEALLGLDNNMIEKEIEIDDVRVGMILSRDIRSGTGLTLLTKNMKLNENNVEAMKRYSQLDPSNSGVFILVEK